MGFRVATEPGPPQWVTDAWQAWTHPPCPLSSDHSHCPRDLTPLLLTGLALYWAPTQGTCSHSPTPKPGSRAQDKKPSPSPLSMSCKLLAPWIGQETLIEITQLPSGGRGEKYLTWIHSFIYSLTAYFQQIFCSLWSIYYLQEVPGIQQWIHQGGENIMFQ